MEAGAGAASGGGIAVPVWGGTGRGTEGERRRDPSLPHRQGAYTHTRTRGGIATQAGTCLCGKGTVGGRHGDGAAAARREDEAMPLLRGLVYYGIGRV